jgi:hypothetical protein
VALLVDTTARTEPLPAALTRVRLRATGLSHRHPEWWVYAVAAVAASVLVLPVVSAAVVDAVQGHSATHSHSMGEAPSGQLPFTTAWVTGWTHWAVMVLAMMLPLLAGHVHTVATRSLWSRRHRASAVFVVAFVSVWFAAGGALVAAGSLLPDPRVWVPPVLLAAAACHVAAPRRRLLRRCTSLRLGHPRGIDADLDCARAGLRSAVRCVGTCGPMMAAMALSHSLLLMTALAMVLVGERSRGPDPLRRAGRPREAWALLALAVLAGAWAAVQ